MTEEITLDAAEAEDLALRACLGAGADERSARALVDATLSAALFGPAAVGFPHMVDYLDSFRDGRINRTPIPALVRPFPAMLASDADGGVAQLGFDLAFKDFAGAARDCGIAIFTQTNSYTTGELGYYVRRLAGEGLVGLAVTNANAVVTPKAGSPAVYGTNPMAFGFPLGDSSLPLIIDQASSATAYVNVLAAAQEGRNIPAGWAVAENGRETQAPHEALAGALLPFGGRKGGNIALLVEMLSAGLSGGPWSLDAPDFRSGSVRPAVGLTVIAIRPGRPEDGRITRARAQTGRLAQLGVFVPGVSGVEPPSLTTKTLKMSRAIHEAISRFAAIEPEQTV